MDDRLTEPGDVMLLYLPLAHNYGRLLHLSAAYIGFTIAFLPDPLRAATELPRVRPHLFPSVPRVYEKIHTAVVAGFDEQHGAKKAIVDWALRVGYRVSKLRQAKQPVPAALAVQHKLADRLVYSKVKARLGGRLRVANAGGAPLSNEIAEFFHAIDILILEGYGLSEITTAATVNRHSDYRFGTVGKPMPGVELRVRRGRRDPRPLEDGLRRLLPRRRGDEGDARRRRLRAHGRHRSPRRRRVPRHHRPQEGHPRHRGRQERRAAESRERAEGAQSSSRRCSSSAIASRTSRRSITVDPESTRGLSDEPIARRGAGAPSTPSTQSGHATSRSSASPCCRASSRSRRTR